MKLFFIPTCIYSVSEFRTCNHRPPYPTSEASEIIVYIRQEEIK